jgi:hypothetical protein
MKNAIKKWLHIQTKDVINSTDGYGNEDESTNQEGINTQHNNREEIIEVRLFKLEEQLKPEPAFKAGDLVNFFLVGNEFEGEITGIDGWTGNWRIKYLNDVNSINEVVVKEEDIWVDEICDICQLREEVAELRYQVELSKSVLTTSKKK